MGLYSPDSIRGPKEIVEYLSDLSSGIPPLLSLFEILVYRATGSFWIVTHLLYRVALALVFFLPIHLFRGNLLSRWTASALSLILLRATVLVHPLNPQIYDVLFPLFGLLYFQFLPRGRRRRSRTAAFFSGLSLAALELCRPFALLVLPLYVVRSFRRFRRVGRDRLLLHLLPILILSGGWHAKLLLANDGQVVWSNHGGFNLMRAWGDLPIEFPEEVVGGEYDPQTKDNILDARVHSELSREASRAVGKFILEHPVQSARRIAERTALFLAPQTAGYQMAPVTGWGLRLYGPAVWFTTAILIGVTVGVLCIAIRDRSLRPVFGIEGVWALTTLFYLPVLAAGEAGEEARLIVTVLPLLAAGVNLLPKGIQRVLALARSASTSATDSGRL